MTRAVAIRAPRLVPRTWNPHVHNTLFGRPLHFGFERFLYVIASKDHHARVKFCVQDPIPRERQKLMPSQELAAYLEKNPGIDANVVAFMHAADLETTMDDSGVSDAVLAVMANILNAEDEDAIFAAANLGALSGQRDYIGIPFLLKRDDVTFRKSGFFFTANPKKDAFPFYTLLKCINLVTGEEDVVSCGAVSVVTTLWRLKQKDIFETYPDGMPLILESKPGAGGNASILLRKYAMPKVPTNGKAKN